MNSASAALVPSIRRLAARLRPHRRACLVLCAALFAIAARMPGAEPAAEPPAPPPAPAVDEEAKKSDEAPPDTVDKWTISVFDKSGKLDKAVYAREARAWSAQAISRRLGPDWEFYHKGKKGSEEKVPTIWLRPSQPSKEGRNGKGFSYQIAGPPTKAPGNFGSEVGQVFYIPDKPGDPGVERISTYDWCNNCIIEIPEPVWWGGTHPDPAVTRPDWIQTNGGPISQAVAMGRSYEGSCHDNDAIMLFSSGFLGCSGTQTSDDHYPCLIFPKHKVPTSVAVTNLNELALVTIWDTQAGKGQVAVIACAAQGLPVHSWPYFALNNNASYGRLKILGYIDIPGMVAPTAIAAWSNSRNFLLPGGQPVGKVRLDGQDMRDRFNKGDMRDFVATTGMAVAISRSEGKAAFIDLQPLFEYVRTMYLTSQENFNKTKDEGMEPKQWPFTFEVEPRCVPKVVTVIRHPNPTAVLIGRRSAPGMLNVCIASVDGKIGIYHVGGLGTDAPAKPEEVVPVAVVQVGRNPTSMQTLRQNTEPLAAEVGPFEQNNLFAVCCRGDREIDWVRIKGSEATVYRRLRDSRLIDPVAIDVCSRAYVISVADFKGRKVINYRLAPTPADHILPHKAFGLGPDDKGEVECGGWMDFPGLVYDINTANVN